MKRLKVTASTSPVEYRSDMMTEDEVRQKYESTVKLYAKTGKDKFLDRMMLLREILRVGGADEDKLYDYYDNMYHGE